MNGLWLGRWLCGYSICAQICEPEHSCLEPHEMLSPACTINTVCVDSGGGGTGGMLRLADLSAEMEWQAATSVRHLASRALCGKMIEDSLLSSLTSMSA